MGKRVKSKGRVGKARPRSQLYSYEFRIKMVRLSLEEGYNTRVLREQFGVGSHSVHRWARSYRQQGPENGEIFQPVKNAAYEIIDRKGTTNFALSLALVRIVSSILRDENSVLSVSTLIADFRRRFWIWLSAAGGWNFCT